MPRAPKRCSFECPKPVFKYGKCKDHQPIKTPWAGSKRQTEFFRSEAWQRQRRRIIFRDKTCQLCGSHDARSVDHILPVWYTGVEEVTDEQLQLLCKSCHDKKSSFEGVQAKRIKKSGLL